MPFAALDLHKHHVEAVILADDGTILLRHRFPTTRAELLDFAKAHLSPAIQLAVEATFNTWPVVNLLQPYVADIVVSNPLRTRAIAEAKIKTDKVDALVLAQLLRLDYLPRVWVPDPATQHLRRATTERAQLTADRTRIKNRIHSVLHQRLIEAPAGDLFSRANLAWLRTLALDRFGRACLDRHLRLLDQIEQEADDVANNLAAHAQQSPETKLLMTLPGMDFVSALTVLAALGDITRFASGNKAAAYLGLVPSTRQSGKHCYHGPITKQGASHARWMLVQAAQHLGQAHGPLGVSFRRLSKKKNRNIAVVATARKLVVIAWHMLKNNEPYRYSQPSATQAKLDRLRIRATGERKKGGNPKGAPRPASYGSGKPTRAVPSLDQVYAHNGLPQLRQPLARGEQAMLAANRLTDFEAGLHQPRRVPRAIGEPPVAAKPKAKARTASIPSSSQ